MLRNGEIVDKQIFPSPNPSIKLSIVTYISEGLKVKGMLAEPVQEGVYDGFLYLRGGIKNVGMVRAGRIIQFASKGFIVMAPFYRGNLGGEGNEDFAGNDRFDAVNAFYLLMKHPQVNPDRIHVFGFSRGGVMALLTGVICSNVRSVVSWGGVSDMFLTYEERKDLRRMMKRVIGGTPKKYPDRYKWRTPLYYLEKMQAPVLIIHGGKDENVSIEHAYRLERRLKELGKQVDSWYFQHFSHHFPPRHNRMVLERMIKWMKN
ncbi:alpha/beta hydrolase family protein [Aeribacillus pallidus]|uniref:Alpha/beta hydrolase n=1 Tax=Aeribacillus pallidus TaxID=33936 RepID=A0A223E598_9BACI|nr:prolyl oligopeptidase family serine peptidase [Aeribacillus pallidus]ASS90424.1 alpha/beta hydrolase [Aeribacillus pallidus]